MAKAPADKTPAGKDTGKAAPKTKAKAAPPSKAADKPAAKVPPPPPRANKPHKPQPAFPKKNQPPTAAAFAARLPIALGKRFELARGFLLKQANVTEDVYFYGPESGWALRYRRDDRPVCSLHIYDEQPIGIVALEPAAIAGIDWRALSPVAATARKQAHGSPASLWLDVPLEGTGATDLRAILRAKLAATTAAATRSPARDDADGAAARDDDQGHDSDD